MAENLSLLEFLKELFTNVQLRDYFAEDPQAALAEYGLNDLSPADVHDALVLAEDNQTADFSREYNTGGNHLQYAPPPPPPASHDGGDDHEAAVRYLNHYITNNYVDDRDTTVDNSTNQQIDTHGGDFDQDIDVTSTVASGDGAVAAGDDIDGSTIVTGDDNQVGDGNVSGNGNVVGDDNEVLQGDHNTASFGDGDANSATFDDVNVGTGGAISVGGDADGNYEVEDSYNTAESTTTNTTTTDYDDSFNTHNENTENSHNDTETNTSSDSHDDVETHIGSHNDTEFDS